MNAPAAEKSKSYNSFVISSWNLFISTKLTVFVMLTLAVSSIVGTLIPQNKTVHAYKHEYSEFWYAVFDRLDLFDMYHSVWFQFLLLMLVVNIIACSINRISLVWKIIFTKTPKYNISRFRKLSNKETFSSNHSHDELIKIYQSFISRQFRQIKVEHLDRGFCIFGENGRWTRLGVYFVHLSIILLGTGAIVGSIYGFDGYINIPEGESISQIQLRNQDVAHDLGFEIKCDKFNVSFYDSGAPKEYRSTLSIIENGRQVLEKDIIVNDPLRHKGTNIFQSSYGKMAPNEVTFDFASRKTGLVYPGKIMVGEGIDIPENLGRFIFKGILNSYNFKGRNIGESVVGTLIRDSGKPLDILVPFRHPVFDKMRNDDVAVSIREFTPRYYTGLQVTQDKGVPVVYAGFMMMIIGCYITFFMSHQSICIEAESENNNTIVHVSGTSNRNKMGMKHKIKKLSRKLEKLSD